jgi:periplasmic protein TonB
MTTDQQGDSPNARLLAGTLQGAQAPLGRLRNALSASMLAHAAGFLVIIFAMSRLPASRQAEPPPLEPPASITWLPQPGPASGGGSGGNEHLQPPRAAELPGREKVTVPVAPPPAPTPEVKPDMVPPPVPLSIPAVSTASGITAMPGVLTAVTMPATDSRGPGTGPGAGTRDGQGIGSGRGGGFGDGGPQGIGDGVFEPGAGVSMPQLIHESKPNYTNEAMRARVQGAVVLEAIVMPDGTVGAAHVTRSLDMVFGLDQEALRTIRQWRFAPGRRGGKPVPVRVAIEMSFTLR